VILTEEETVLVERQPWMYRAGEHPRDDQEYLELLTRVVFAAGLGPRVVASRWEGMREAMGGFAAAHLANLAPGEVERLLADPRMIRNRRKIEATIANAGAFREVLAEYGTFADYLEEYGVRRSFGPTVQDLSGRFRHLGQTSAVLFLFSAGWRDQEDEEEAGLGEGAAGPAEATATEGVGENQPAPIAAVAPA
jgi:DNA-3-methyladenine glycosylase I